jgi:phosphoserine phosphatase RsbU/P
MGSEWKQEPILRLVAGSTPVKTIPIAFGSLLIGRNKECQAVLVGDSKVSKRHAELRRDASGVYLRDLKSTNGTTVNGELLQDGERQLHDGDKVRICEHLFVFHSTLVTLSDDDDSSKIIGSIDMASSSRLMTKVRSEERLLAILDISRDIGNTLHLREVLEKTLGSLFRIFPQAERGFILLRKAIGGDPVLQAVKHRSPEGGALTVSTTVFAHVMDKGTAILSQNLVAAFPKSESLQGTEIRTMMGVPLLDQQRNPIGMIQIDTFDQKSKFSQEDLDLLVAVAGPIGLAVENASLHEERIRFTNIQASLVAAREVQFAMLPESRPDVPNYEFWDFYEPAESVGGDYFDYMPLKGPASESKVWAVILGDVAGHGMPAALMVAKLSSEARMCFLTEPDPVEAMEKLNRQLADVRFPERFITFLGTVLDVEANTLTIINAGHMGPMVRRANGRVEILGEQEGGPPLAIFENTKYRATQTKLELGDVVILYTDGVHEAMNPECEIFCTNRLKRTIETAPAGAEAVVDAIVRAVRQHAAGSPQSDDIGIVCFRRI